MDGTKIEQRAASSKPAVFRDAHLSLIPVLVTGIQPAQVFGLSEVFPSRRRASAGFL
jgi:hypothetical protein